MSTGQQQRRIRRIERRRRPPPVRCVWVEAGQPVPPAGEGETVIAVRWMRPDEQEPATE
jgi:hypothetical protein